MRVLALSLCCLLALVAAVATQAKSVSQADALEGDVDVQVAPQTLLLGTYQCGEVTVHAAIPYAIVDEGSLTLNGVPAISAKADNRGELVAKFSEDEIKAIVAQPSAVLTLAGATLDGAAFSGSDVVAVRVCMK